MRNIQSRILEESKQNGKCGIPEFNTPSRLNKIFGTGYDSFELASSDMTGVCLDVVCHSDTDGNSPKDDGRT